jgi:hypothetical protein
MGTLRTDLTLSRAQADALLGEWLGGATNVTLSPFAPALEILGRRLPELGRDMRGTRDFP